MDNSLNGEFILNGDTEVEKSGGGNNSQPAPASTPKKLAGALHFYSSYCPNPTGLNFSDLEANETILLLLRRHFITNFPWIAASTILIFLPFAFGRLFVSLSPFPVPSPHVLLLLGAFYYLAIFGFILLNFTLWYFQAGLVTSLRVIDVDLSGVLYRQVSEAKVQNIEDVTYNQSGFVRSLFNYGNVLVQTAGSEDNIEYDRVPHPSKVAEIIGDLAQPV